MSCNAWLWFVVGAAGLCPAQSERQSYSFVERKPSTRMEKTIDALLPSLVKVHGASGIQTIESYCTGVIVSDKGHVLTLDLVLIQKGQTKIVLADGTVCDAVELLPAERSLGVRMLKIGRADLARLDKPLVPLSPAKRQDHANGTFVVSIGNCYRLAEFSEKLSAMFGVVVARAKTGLRYRLQDVEHRGELLITDAPNNPGHYGGGLFTLSGEWIGLNARVLDSTETNTQISAAIPTEQLRAYITASIEGKPFDVADVGPRGKPVFHGIQLFDTAGRRSPPAYVERVSRGSPGFKAGLRADDLIVQLGEMTIRTCVEFRRCLKDFKPGDETVLIFKRGSTIKQTKIRFEEEPE